MRCSEFNTDFFEIRDDGRLPPSYSCRLINKPETKNAEKHEGVIKLFTNWYGFIESDDGDYYFTKSNIVKNQQKIWIKKRMKVLFDVIKPPNSSGTEIQEINGKAGNVEFIDVDELESQSQS